MNIIGFSPRQGGVGNPVFICSLTAREYIFALVRGTLISA